MIAIWLLWSWPSVGFATALNCCVIFPWVLWKPSCCIPSGDFRWIVCRRKGLKHPPERSAHKVPETARSKIGDGLSQHEPTNSNLPVDIWYNIYIYILQKQSQLRIPKRHQVAAHWVDSTVTLLVLQRALCGRMPSDTWSKNHGENSENHSLNSAHRWRDFV